MALNTLIELLLEFGKIVGFLVDRDDDDAIELDDICIDPG